MQIVFSLGDHRRKVLGPSSSLPPDYFSPNDRSAATEQMRKQVKQSLEGEVEKFFKENRGQVAIYDANVSWCVHLVWGKYERLI